MKFRIRQLLFAAAMPVLVAAAPATAPAASPDAGSWTRIDELDRKLDEVAGNIAPFFDQLPAEREADKCLRDIAKIAEANALQSRWIKPQRPISTADYTEQRVQFALVGDFKDVFQFLLQVEKRPQAMRTRQLSFRAGNDARKLDV